MIDSNHLLLLEQESKYLGYKIVQSDCDSWDYESRIICVNSKRTTKNKVIHLLHELGHAILMANIELSGDYYDRFPGLKPNAESSVHKISEIEQEILAWEHGRLLAFRLGIPLDKSFHQIKTKCLKTYFTKEINDISKY